MKTRESGFWKYYPECCYTNRSNNASSLRVALLRGNWMLTADEILIVLRWPLFWLYLLHPTSYQNSNNLRNARVLFGDNKFKANKPINSKTAHPPRAIPGHLTLVKFRTVVNLTQNEARPVGHLTFLSKRLSAVRSKRISQFFDSAREPRSLVIALVDSTWVFCCCCCFI